MRRGGGSLDQMYAESQRKQDASDAAPVDGDFAALDALLNGADGSAEAAASVGGTTVLAPDDPFAELQNMLGLGDEES